MPRALSIALCCALTIVGCGPPPEPVQEIRPESTIRAAVPINVGVQDWPWWRGPSRNHVAPCSEVPTTWSTTTNVVWKSAIPGRGHGSPCVVADHIYLCTADETAETQNVVCFSRHDGQQLWNTEVHAGGFPGSGRMHHKSTHANGSVACDGTNLFVAFLNAGAIHLTSLTTTGKIQWQTNTGAFHAKFGYAPSPCLFESLVIVSADNRGGGYLAAVHRDTGQIVWRTARGNVDTYSSAIVAEIADGPQLLISGGNQVASYNPRTGETNWTCPGSASATCGTCVFDGQLVFASGGHPERQTICIDATTGNRVWEDGLKCYEQSMLLSNGNLFAVTDDGIAVCREAATGKLHWRHRLNGPFSASPLLVGELIYATNESGRTWVFKADADAFNQIARNDLGNESFASLVACGNRIYTRVAMRENGQRQEYLYCLGSDELTDAARKAATAGIGTIRE